jgi:hypothetical protein
MANLNIFFMQGKIINNFGMQTSEDTQLKFYKTVALSCLMYGSES